MFDAEGEVGAFDAEGDVEVMDAEGEVEVFEAEEEEGDDETVERVDEVEDLCKSMGDGSSSGLRAS